uniref:Uncharacterized protein n=1 Tax=Graphocephala atropunctata TaxID=36148 RepID=A0A1B6MBQ0_9HEMI
MTQGIAFEKLKDTVVNENVWRVVLDFNIRGLSEEADRLETVYSIVREQFMNLSDVKHDAAYWFKDLDLELEKVRLTIDSYKVDLEGLIELLPKERVKRGLINLGGYVAKYLFGVATTDDIEATNHKVNLLHDIASNVIHSKEDQLTLLKDVNSKIGINTKSIVEVMEKLANFSANVSNSLNKTMTHWTEMYDYLIHFLYIGNEVRQLGQVTDEAKIRSVEFRQALELVKTNRLSSKLLPPNEFLPILLKIEKLLPIDLRLPVSANAEDVFLYYDLCKTQAVSTENSIRLFITIPLTSSASQFETYKIHVIPIFNPALKHWVLWKLSLDYLLISGDRQYYLPTSAFDLSKCEESVYFWCPNFASIRKNTVADCYYKLFMGIESGKQCNKVIKTDVLAPYWIRNGNDWIYSVAEPTKITLKCWNYDLSSKDHVCEIKDLEIKGSGKLTNVPRCEIFGSNFRIFHRIQGNTKYEKNVTNLHIPNFNSMIPSFDNETLTLNLDMTFDTINTLKTELGNDTVEISLEKLINRLKNTNSSIKVNYDYRIEFFVIVIISICIMFLLVVFLCCRRKERGQTLMFTRGTVNRRQPIADQPQIVLSDALRDVIYATN